MVEKRLWLIKSKIIVFFTVYENWMKNASVGRQIKTKKKKYNNSSGKSRPYNIVQFSLELV